MARQAKRKKPAKSTSSRKPSSGVTKSCLGFLLSGVLVGVLGTLLVQGMRSSSSHDMGSGIREMVEQSRQADAARKAKKPESEPVLMSRDQPRKKVDYDFYTVLPGIEEVIPKDAPEPPPVSAVKTAPSTGQAGQQVAVASKEYVLQVASYGRMADADKLKAELTLKGWRTAIQTVSIDNKTYYRVRVGPFSDYGNMTAVDYELAKMGHQTLRLRVAK